MSRRKLAIRELEALARARPAAEATTELEAVLRLFGQTKPCALGQLVGSMAHQGRTGPRAADAGVTA